jgi:hypothetical protein
MFMRLDGAVASAAGRPLAWRLARRREADGGCGMQPAREARGLASAAQRDHAVSHCLNQAMALPEDSEKPFT